MNGDFGTWREEGGWKHAIEGRQYEAESLLHLEEAIFDETEHDSDDDDALISLADDDFLVLERAPEGSLPPISAVGGVSAFEQDVVNQLQTLCGEPQAWNAKKKVIDAFKESPIWDAWSTAGHNEQKLVNFIHRLRMKRFKESGCSTMESFVEGEGPVGSVAEAVVGGVGRGATTVGGAAREEAGLVKADAGGPDDNSSETSHPPSSRSADSDECEQMVLRQRTTISITHVEACQPEVDEREQVLKVMRDMRVAEGLAGGGA